MAAWRWGITRGLQRLRLTEEEMRPPRSRNPCCLAARGLTEPPTPTLPVCESHSQCPLTPPQSQRTGPRGDTPSQQSQSPPNVPSTLVLWRFCRLGTLVPGPEGLRRPWGTGAVGRGAPGLIGDPRNNEGWEAGGLIGPGSGLAFVWDSPCRRPRGSRSRTQAGDSGWGRVRWGPRGRGDESPSCARGPGVSRGPGISLHHTRGAAVTTR